MTRKWDKLNSTQPPSKNSIQRFLPSQKQRLEVQSFLHPLKPPLGQGGGHAAAPVLASEGLWLFDSALLSCSTIFLSCSPLEGFLLILGVTASPRSSCHSFLGTGFPWKPRALLQPTAHHFWPLPYGHSPICKVF